MKNLFSLDLRSLALFRVSLALIFLYDLLTRFGHRDVFYTDSGVLTRSVFIEQYQLPWKFSLLLLNGSIEFVNLLIGIGLIAGLMFFFGIRTKIAGFVCWTLLMSFHERHHLISHGGDNLLRILFFWSLFLPLNAKFSFDAILSKANVTEKSISNVFSFSYIAQVCFIYIFTSLYKLHPSWTKDFTAVYYTLNLEMFAKPLGSWIAQFDILTKFLTAMTMLIESFGIFLIFVPYKNYIFRMNAIILFFGLHFGIWMTMYLGIFAPVCLAAWVPFLPSEFWDGLFERAKKRAKQIQIFYDEDCGFCLKMAYLVKTFFGLLNTEIKPAQKNSKINKIMEEKNSWVLSIDGKEYVQYNALLKLITYSPFRLVLWPLYLFKPIGSNIYSAVANNRSWCDKVLKSIGYSSVRLDYGFLTRSLSKFLIVTVLLWNVEGYVGYKKFDLKSPWPEIVFALQLNQQWNMFAPYPMTEDGWFVSEATFLDDSTYDILNDKFVTDEKPQNVAQTYKDSSWHKYLMNLWLSENAQHRVYFGKYACKKWNRENYNKIKSFKLYFMLELTPPMGYPTPEATKTLLHEQNCFE